VALKANFNSVDSFPASTHPETLKILVKMLKEAGIKDLILVERSAMGNTRKVLDYAGVFELAQELGLKLWFWMKRIKMLG